jgi:broad specificity phosphatase PhoE
MESLLLVRHAFARSNRDGTASSTPPGEGLTKEGAAQARRVADMLVADEVSLGIASEFLRTQETLGLALAGRTIDRLVVPELNEIDFGSFDGGSLAEYRAWAAAHPADEPAPGEGESRADAAARFARGLDVVLARTERVVALVGHALFVRYVLDAANGLAPAQVMTPVEHASPYRLDVRDVETAARLLADWSQSPRFRDPSEEG